MLTAVVSFKFSLLRTDCFHYTTSTPGLPPCFQEAHTCQLLVPFSAFSTMRFLSSLREHGYVFTPVLSQEVWLQLPSYICSLSDQDPSTLGHMELFIICIHGIIYRAWDSLSKQKTLGALFLLVLFV